jgi:hypothetical protein
VAAVDAELVVQDAQALRPAWSRLSKMKRCAALTIAAGPTYCSLAQKDGQEVVQAAHRMHLVVSSKRSRSSALQALACRAPGRR